MQVKLYSFNITETKGDKGVGNLGRAYASHPFVSALCMYIVLAMCCMVQVKRFMAILHLI